MRKRILLREASLRDGRTVDVRLRDGHVRTVAPRLEPVEGEEVLHVGGGAVIPALHDHHLHLLAMGAADSSVPCGPPAVNDAAELRVVLRSAPAPAGWVRGIGYHESVAGQLDRVGLDRMRSDVPVRIQHRSGALWMLNSPAVQLLGVDADDTRWPAGVERDADGRSTGRLWGLDAWMRSRLGPQPAPDLAAVGARLAAWGIGGVTDATPNLRPSAVTLLRRAVQVGDLPQRLQLLGLAQGQPMGHERIRSGPRKLVLADHDLPTLPALLSLLRASDRGTRRPVAVHCVTVAALVLLLAALEEAGPVPGDRVEHAALVPDACIASLRDLGVTVVTQPSLLCERGEQYRRDVAPKEVPWLYRHRSLLAAGVPVALSSDAPYASADPWATIRSASRRTTTAGVVLGVDERVSASQALDALLTPLSSPGGPPRRVQPGVRADLCVLRAPLARVLADPTSQAVRGTILGGTPVRWDQD